MRISLDESVTVRTIDAVRLSVLGAWEKDPALEIDASAVAEVDLSLVQLILAARAHATRKGSSLTLVAPANDALAGLLRRGGFLSNPSSNDIDFWFHGDLPQ